MAAKVCEYATFALPAVRVVLVEMARAAVIVSVSDPEVADAPALSVTFTLIVEAPAFVGVPLNMPAALSVMPVGNVPVETVQLEYGGEPPVAASVCE